MTQSAQNIEQISYTATQLEQIGNIIDALRQQIEQQIKDGTNAINQLEQNEQNSLVLIIKRVRPLTDRLSTQTQKVEAIVNEISIDVKETIDLLDSNSNNSPADIPKKQAIPIQSDPALHSRVRAITGKIIQVIEQTQNLAVVNQFLLQITNRANQKLAKDD